MISLANGRYHLSTQFCQFSSDTFFNFIFLNFCPNVLDLTISVGSINKQTWLFNKIANYFENNVNVHACMLTKHSNNKLKANKLS